MKAKILKFTETPLFARLFRRFPVARRLQTAQGMVEFALVLPILLMLLLGIIAFSHMFFVYSMTVSASREAARWGAAVGVTGSGVARYRDCASIRLEAERVGRVVGVAAGNVTVAYDRGPGTAQYNTCPAPGLAPFGPADADVHLGDRIVVTVNVNYTPIVPFINIPSRLLTAETARTIIKALPVGEAPIASDPCGKTPVIKFLTDPAYDPSNPVLPPEQPIKIIAYVIINETGAGAQGTLTVSDDTGLSGHSCTTTNAGVGVASCEFTFPASLVGQPVTFQLEYVSGMSCPADTSIPAIVKIGKGNTYVQILSDLPKVSIPGGSTDIVVSVGKALPSTGFVGSGTVDVIDISQPGVTCTVFALNAANGQGHCQLQYPLGSIQGMHQLKAMYSGSNAYNKSDSTVDLPGPGIPPQGPYPHLVQNATATPTPTPTGTGTVMTPTITSTATPSATPTRTRTPTKTPLPPWCPSASSLNFAEAVPDPKDSSQTIIMDSAIRVDVTNPSIASSAVTITSATINWVEAPPKPVFQEVRFGPYSPNTCATGAPCIWQGTENNTPVTIGLASPSIDINQTQQLRFNFSRSLHNGVHYITLVFSNNCILELAGDRNQ